MCVGALDLTLWFIVQSSGMFEVKIYIQFCQRKIKWTKDRTHPFSKQAHTPEEPGLLIMDKTYHSGTSEEQAVAPEDCSGTRQANARSLLRASLVAVYDSPTTRP